MPKPDIERRVIDASGSNAMMRCRSRWSGAVVWFASVSMKQANHSPGRQYHVARARRLRRVPGSPELQRKPQITASARMIRSAQRHCRVLLFLAPASYLKHVADQPSRRRPLGISTSRKTDCLCVIRTERRVASRASYRRLSSHSRWPHRVRDRDDRRPLGDRIPILGSHRCGGPAGPTARLHRRSSIAAFEDRRPNYRMRRSGGGQCDAVCRPACRRSRR